MSEEFLSGRVRLECGDCLDVLARLDENSVDSVVTDPPYHLTSIVKRFGADNAAPAKPGKTGAYARSSAGFMGRVWDGGDIAFNPETWRLVLRVLKPGGYIVAFSSSRTFGRMSVAIEDAGFITHPLIGWIFGQGFPKAHRVHLEGYEGWRYGGQALKPALEPIYMGQKPFSEVNGTENVRRWSTGAINIDKCRVETDEGLNGGAYREGEPSAERVYTGAGSTNFTMKPGPRRGRAPMPGDERQGAALGMFQDGKIVGAQFSQPIGRWPANLMTDGSPEVFAAFPNSDGQQGDVSGNEPSALTNNCYGDFNGRPATVARNDTGSAARFFWSSKAAADDRLGSRHPTIKPVDLIEELVTLVTPTGGTTLDCFAGTGTTAEAAFRRGFNAVLIEREPEYQDDIRRRMSLVLGGPDERARESIKAKLKDKPIDAGPLFAAGVQI